MWPPSTPMSAAILCCGGGAADVGGGGRQHQVVRVRSHRLAHRVDLVAARASTAIGPVTSPGIQIEKKSASRPPSRMRGMSMLPSGLRARDVERLLEDQPLRRVVVRVDDDRPLVQLPGAGGDGGVLGGLGEGGDGQDQGEGCEALSHARTLLRRERVSSGTAPFPVSRTRARR